MKNKYCSDCGAVMIKTLIPANEATCDYGDGTMPYDTKFDEETGKRQFVENYRCPNKPTKFPKTLFNNHDEYFLHGLIIK